jgi:hypothetical protein
MNFMKAFLFFICCFSSLYSFATPDRIDSLPGKVLIINSFDANDNKARDKKQKLMNDLAQLLQQDLYLKIRADHGIETFIVDGIIKQSNTDSIIAMINSQQATKAVRITFLDVYFEQTHVDVSGTKGNKTRIAYYDICVKATFEFYNRQGRLSESPIERCEFFSHRNVVSGLLAAGPDVVKRKKDAERMILVCAREYSATIRNEMMAN